MPYISACNQRGHVRSNAAPKSMFQHSDSNLHEHHHDVNRPRLHIMQCIRVFLVAKPSTNRLAEARVAQLDTVGMWNSIRNVVVSRSRSLDDNDVQPKYSQTRTSSERSLAELEQDCRRMVSATGLDVRLPLVCCSTRLDLDLDPDCAGRQQYVSRATTNVSNLWSLIDMQKKRIQSLESQLSCLQELARSYKACETLPQPLKGTFSALHLFPGHLYAAGFATFSHVC